MSRSFLTKESQTRQPRIRGWKGKSPRRQPNNPPMLARTYVPTFPGLRYLLKHPWAVLLSFHARVAQGSCRAAPVHVDPIGTGPATGATEVGLPIGLVAWESSQWYHSILAGGGQKGTSRKTQVCGMFWNDRRTEVCLGQGGPGQPPVP